MRNRGIGRGRLFLGGLILFAAIIAWGTALMMSPHSDATIAQGTQHLRTTVVVFVRNSAIGTLLLSALAGWLLFPARRPNKPWRDWAVAAILAVMVLTSVYQLIWLRNAL